MKVTRSLLIAREIKAEIGGNIHEIQARVAGIIFGNPELSDDEVAFLFAVNN